MPSVLKSEFMPPKYRGDENGDWSPRSGVPLVFKDYAGSCDAPYNAELREERLNFVRDRDVYASSPLEGGPVEGGAFGIPLNQLVAGETQYVRRAFPCGKCTACINFRKAKYQRAALGWFLTTDATVLGTLTFDDFWFMRRWREKSDREEADLLERYRENLKGLPGLDDFLSVAEKTLRLDAPHYKPGNKIHRDLAEQWLGEERSAMIKRLRSSLRDRADWAGATLTARMEVLELGKRKKRLHAHLLWHWDNVPTGFVRRLKEWVRHDWQHKSGVGFIQLRKVRDDAAAIYQCKYIGKFETDAHGQKLYVASGNPVPQSNGYLDKGFKRLLAARPVPDREAANEALGIAQGECHGGVGAAHDALA